MRKQSGGVDSRYFYNPEQLEADMQHKQEKRDRFKKILRELIISNPGEMDLRYKDCIDVLKELKEEFNL